MSADRLTQASIICEFDVASMCALSHAYII
jgi:hypothetical protein